MRPARLGALLGLAAIAALPLVASAQRDEPRRAVLVISVQGMGFDELLAVPEVFDVARAGGAAILVGPDDARASVPDPVEVTSLDIDGSPEGQVTRLIRAADADEVLVVMFGSPDVGPAREDATTAIVLAAGAPLDITSGEGRPVTLTSDSTRRKGVIAGADVGSTVASFLDVGVETDGSPIRIVSGDPPFQLHDRYEAQRRMYVPVGTAAALYVTGAGIVALALSYLSGRASLRRVVGWGSLCVPMLAVGLLAAGHLPDLSYATAVPMVAIVTVFGTLAFSPLEREDATLVPVGIGAAVLAFLAVEAVLGWPAMLTPLLGGSQLDGGRFYGLPNVAIGLLAGAGLWVAHRLPVRAGSVLLFVAASFAGLPLVGSNLGGGITLSAAAGAWLAVRERERLGRLAAVGMAAGITAAGTAVILVAHAVSPVATHVTRFERDVDGVRGVVDRFVDRLQVGFDLIANSPPAIVPVLGLPLVVILVFRPPPGVRATFERRPAWRDAILVTALTGIVALLVNDSGPAAAGLAFGMALGGMLGVSLLERPGKMAA